MTSLARVFRSIRGKALMFTRIPQTRARVGRIILTNFYKEQFQTAAVKTFSSNRDNSRTDKGRNGLQSDSDSDSDDEVNCYSHKGESDFWRRKMRTLHGLLDVNKDGIVSFDDFILLTDRFVNLGHMTARHHAEFIKIMQEIWETQYGVVDKYNLITTEQFLVEMHHALNDKQLRKNLHKFLPYLFKAVDKDKSGEITVEEYKLFFRCLGLDNEAAVISFNAIDENSDGRLSIKEFIHLGKDFFLSEDERKSSKFFWGPLVQKAQFTYDSYAWGKDLDDED